MLQGVLTAPGLAEPVRTLRDAGLKDRCFDRSQIDAIPDAKGAYALLIQLDRDVNVALRNRRPERLHPGWFVYLGSANGPGGLRARLRRHFSIEKKPHWHVDPLTMAAVELAAIPVIGGSECALVAGLAKHPAFGVAIEGFGSTDCRTCDSHLLRIHPH